MVNQTLQEYQQKSNKEIQDLEKEIITIQEENRMLGEDRADFENKLRTALDENDQMQRQIIEG